MLEGSNQWIVKYITEKNGGCVSGSCNPINYLNLQGPEYDLEARYKSNVIARYQKNLL